MEELILKILGSRMVLNISAWLAVFLLFTFAYLFFRKKGRDERGRGVFAYACFISMCTYAFLVNAVGFLPREVFEDSLMSRNLLTCIFDMVFIIQIIAVVILDKFK